MTTLTIVLIVAGSFIYVTSNLLLAFVYAATGEDSESKFKRIAFFFSVILFGVPIYAVLFFMYFLDVAGYSRLFYVLTHKKKLSGMTQDNIKLFNELISDKKGMLCYTNDRICRYFVNRWNKEK